MIKYYILVLAVLPLCFSVQQKSHLVPDTTEGHSDVSCSKDFEESEERNFLEWSQTNPVLVKQDRDRENLILTDIIASGLSLEAIRDMFYKMTSMTSQTKCQIGKEFGGRWISSCGFFDCQKYVCMDKLYKDIIKGECLVYSYGIGNDCSFELAMANLGCTVRTFDIKEATDEEFMAHPNITFTRKALVGNLGDQEFRMDAGDKKVEVQTLSQAMESHNDSAKKISYLKVDVEGYEIQALPDWIKLGLTKNIDQIGLEIHTGRSFVKKEQIKKTLIGLIKNIQELYRQGFRIIHYNANSCKGKKEDFTQKYHALFDIVLFK